MTVLRPRISVEQLRARLTYCPDTGLLTWLPSASKAYGGKVAASLDKDGYIKLTVAGVCLQGHRVAWAMFHGAWPEGCLDHANRDPADNRIANLRLATVSQNNANRTIMRTNTHGDKGVTRLPSGSWQAQIQVSGKNNYLGAFREKADAIAAYAKAARLYFGEFALVEVRP